MPTRPIFQIKWNLTRHILTCNRVQSCSVLTRQLTWEPDLLFFVFFPLKQFLVPQHVLCF